MDGWPFISLTSGIMDCMQLLVRYSNLAVLSIVACGAFNLLAKYFYSNYKLLFGIIYPAYKSYKSQKKRNSRENTRWMKYWICFGAFCAVELLTDLFLSFWLPLYYEAKIFFLLWLMSPYSNGANVLYTTVIKPQLDKQEVVIDKFIKNFSNIIIDSFKQLWTTLCSLYNHFKSTKEPC